MSRILERLGDSPDEAKLMLTLIAWHAVISGPNGYSPGAAADEAVRQAEALVERLEKNDA